MDYIDQRPLDENGKAHGEWLTYYGNGQLMHRWNYFHNNPHGLHESYDMYGTLRYRGHYNMGRAIGYWRYEHQPNEYYLWLI